jgi:hypothetical protein
VGRHNDGGQGRVRGGRVQFVDARELQERVQQQIRRSVQRVRGRGQEGTVGRRPRGQLGGRLSEGGARLGLAVGRVDSRGRMVKVKIGCGAVAVAHKLVRALGSQRDRAAVLQGGSAEGEARSDGGG